MRYSVALVSPALALLLTLSVPHAHKDPFFSLFMAAVAFSTWFGGLRPGILATGLSALGGAYLVPPEGSIGGKNIHDVIQYLIFVATTLLIVGLITALQRARGRLQRSQERLSESEARFRSVAESIPQLVWSTSADGRLDYINRRWCEYTGQTVEQALDAGWQTAVNPEDRDRIAARWDQCLHTGEVFELEIRLKRVDGSYRSVLARALPLHGAGGEITKWFGTCTDIQQQKQAEEMLRTSEKLAAVARLASAMAHEINNPLAAVTNLLFLLQETTSDHTSSEYVRAARAELARITHIANQTLGLYREASEPVRLKVSEVVEDVVDMYANHARSRGAVVKQECACAGEMLGHRGDLRQLLSNLLLNGIESLEDGGEVRVRLSAGYDRRQPGSTGVRIVVADTGRGIPPEHRHKIFEPFFTTKTEKASGLGLWVVEEIVQRYGGAIRLRSSVRPGQSGTVVSIFLPAEATGLTRGTSATVAA